MHPTIFWAVSSDIVVLSSWLNIYIDLASVLGLEWMLVGLDGDN